MMTKEITKQIRNDLKVMKGFKFSVRTEYFSMGSSITVKVLKSPIKVYKKSGVNYQLNQYQLDSDYYKEYLTDEILIELKKILDIVNKYHWDESDSQTDYFNCNFYFHFHLGEWDKDVIEVIS